MLTRALEKSLQSGRGTPSLPTLLHGFATQALLRIALVLHASRLVSGCLLWATSLACVEVVRLPAYMISLTDNLAL